MKKLLNITLLFVMAFAFVKCSDDEPVVDLSPKMLASEMEALQAIYSELDMDAEDYPVHWDLENPNSWEGIELDTIANEETGENVLVIKSITIYLAKLFVHVPESLRKLSYLYELKIYGCEGSYFDGRRIPNTVKKLLVDRINPDEDQGYIWGVHYRSPIYPERLEVSLNYETCFEEVTIHGVDMQSIGFNFEWDTKIDLSYNTLRGDVFTEYTRFLDRSANLSHNQFSSLEEGWKYWIGNYMIRRSMPNLQYNDFKNIPEYVFESDFWKENHEYFIGNPGYRPPVEKE